MSSQAAQSRERILKAVNHEPLDRIPTDMWATTEVQEKLFNHFNISTGQDTASSCVGLLGGPLSRSVEAIIELWDILGVDGIFDVSPPYIGPELPAEGDTRFNEWGFGYRVKCYGSGAYEEQVVYPLIEASSSKDLDSYRWPDPDWYDYDVLPGIIDSCGGRAVCCGYSAVFTYHNYLRGLEASLMDPLMDPEMCREIIKRLSDFFHEYHARCFAAGKGRIDFTQVTDDWGGQVGLMSSPSIFEEFYKESMVRAIELAKLYDIKVFHHDDGDMRQLLPQLTGMGIDILNPIQWRCGDWDLKALKHEYGGRVCFHSAVDNQETLPWGTPEEVDVQVQYLIQTLASDGTGCIIGPCHNLQPNTSVENILALYGATRKYGKLK